ncbi:MAG: 2-hydroxychromene-2-carboxylate isomerase [Haliea sp.]|jgi:2-hydroxychromene-2-carboxylate isomerase|nr:2-hydroxychromene-2-carboxylate isomerase [Haliea sp.]
MSKTLEFYFDFGSPTTYLAYKRLQQLREQYGLEIVYKPVLLGGLFKATGNTTPVAVPAKGKYMLESDLPRFARRYGVPLAFNPHFPINTLNLMRGAIAAQRLDCLDPYLDAMYDAVWVAGENMGDAEVVARVLTDKQLDAAALLELAQDPEVKAELASNTEEAVERGAFGAPTMYMDGEMYFGQDRLDFVEEALTGN